MRCLRSFVPAAALLCIFGCGTPDVAAGLDQYNCDGGLCPVPGVVQGKLVYSGPVRGDAILLLFDVTALPPPEGQATAPAALARVPMSFLFANADPANRGPFSASFTFTQVPSGHTYQVRAFIDGSRQFDPFFDYSRQPRAGDPVGGYGDVGADGQVHLIDFAVGAGQLVSGINVALPQTMSYDPPSFELVGGPQTIDQNIDQPVHLKLHTVRLPAQIAAFDQAHFALELDRDAQGNRQSSLGDGLDDVFPRVFLRQLAGMDDQGRPLPIDPSLAAIVPCRVVSTPVLPALVDAPAGAAPLPTDLLDVLVQPLAVSAVEQQTVLPEIPAGTYQVVVIQRSGQVWTLPNQLGDAKSAGTPYYAASQAQAVTMMPPAGVSGYNVSGTVVWSGDPSIRSGNILVQAYRDDPFNPPPPLGAALPVRVRVVLASAAVPSATGFSAPFRIDGLPQGTYFIQALDDVDGNFSSLKLMATPTNGDLTGALLSGGLPAKIAVSANVTGVTVTLASRVTSDPPAFEVDPATPAQMPADQVTPLRFRVRARPLSFPLGKAPNPRFAVQLVRDGGGAAVDADHDGLPDVWPRVFLVRLDASDPAGLTQYVSPDLHTTQTQIIPAAVDPTPFLPALQPQPGPGVAPVLTDTLSIVVRPVLLDATAPGAAPARLPSLQPGAYRIVLLSQSGQVWQIPNEAGSAALAPSVICAAGASACAPGTVQTQSQSAAFQVGPPSHPPFSGGITGLLQVSGTPLSAYVFAYAANALPPFGRPMSADFHTGSEFQGGSVRYTLPNLPTGDYVLTAVVDTRGDFAASPPLFALAPGAGNVVMAPASVHVGTSFVTSNLIATSPVPQRPSFELLDASSNPATSDVGLAFSGGTLASFKIRGVAVLGPGVVALRPDAAGAIPLTCDGSGKVVATSLGIQLIKVSDPAGLVPELDGSGKATVIAGGLDPTQFTGVSCTPGTVYLATGALTAFASGPSKVNLMDPSVPPVPIPVVAGRYSVSVTSVVRQVWRVPNELQPALLDPHAVTPAATLTLLQTQQVALNVTP